MIRPNLSAALTLVLLPIATFAVKAKEAPIPYDADLFHKDIEVVSGHAEFLYWTVDEGALDYAQKMDQPAASVSYAVGKVKSASFHIDPGVRLAVSYFNAPKLWEVKGQYTHLISKGKDRAEKPSAATEYLTGTWPQIVTNPLVHAHSSIAFNYNLFDLSVARIFITNPHFRLRLVAGLGAAWIKQDWKVRYFDTSAQSSTIRNQWKYTGGGMRLGMTGDWFWGSDFYLTGLTSLGVYMGSYHNHARQSSSISSLILRNSRFSDARPAFTAQFLIGPSWQKNFCCRRIEVFTGYEINAWFNLQEIHRSTGGDPTVAKESRINTGVLALQGLTTRLTVDF